MTDSAAIARLKAEAAQAAADAAAAKAAAAQAALDAAIASTPPRPWSRPVSPALLTESPPLKRPTPSP